MGDYLSNVNAGVLYLIVACVLAFITVMCVIFLVKSYRAGIKIGMDIASVHQYFAKSPQIAVIPVVHWHC